MYVYCSFRSELFTLIESKESSIYCRAYQHFQIYADESDLCCNLRSHASAVAHGPAALLKWR